MKRAVIIGAGPAGLTAAYELLERTDIVPIVLEANREYVGGISKTVEYRGNRIDIGGHRFFSKSDRVMEWWARMMPVAEEEDERDRDRMLVRRRKSRIWFERHLFDYPLTLSFQLVRSLGVVRVMKIGVTYLYRMVFPRKHERSLEDFFINRFGDELYRTFFKSYTEKVWGKPCSEISAAWGAQRIKGVSVKKALEHALRSAVRGKKDRGLSQKEIETSLIDRFLYPKYGPGQLWERVARLVQEKGGEVRVGARAVGLDVVDGAVRAVEVEYGNGTRERVHADYVVSTMPIVELVAALGTSVPTDVQAIARGLEYRDFITVGVLAEATNPKIGPIDDTWIYVHDRDALMCRVQFFQNWSPYMVADPSRTWIGLEYICSESDQIWQQDDAAVAAFAIDELVRTGMVEDRSVVHDSVVLREKKAYPAYTGTYAEFQKVQEHLLSYDNLFPIGRNGMHRYNNQDHSMLTAMVTVDLLAGDVTIGKADIWSVNTEQTYHEQK